MPRTFYLIFCILFILLLPYASTIQPTVPAPIIPSPVPVSTTSSSTTTNGTTPNQTTTSEEVDPPKVITEIIEPATMASIPTAAAGRDLRKATEETKEKFVPIIRVLIAAFSLSLIISTAACAILWYTFFYLYANIYRIMWSLEEKVRIATRRLSDRKLGSDIMAQIQNMAPYDAAQNNQEISTMLKSVAKSQNKQQQQPPLPPPAQP